MVDISNSTVLGVGDYGQSACFHQYDVEAQDSFESRLAQHGITNLFGEVGEGYIVFSDCPYEKVIITDTPGLLGEDVYATIKYGE